VTAANDAAGAFSFLARVDGFFATAAGFVAFFARAFFFVCAFLRFIFIELRRSCFPMHGDVVDLAAERHGRRHVVRRLDGEPAWSW